MWKTCMEDGILRAWCCRMPHSPGCKSLPQAAKGLAALPGVPHEKDGFLSDNSGACLGQGENVRVKSPLR